MQYSIHHLKSGQLWILNITRQTADETVFLSLELQHYNITFLLQYFLQPVTNFFDACCNLLRYFCIKGRRVRLRFLAEYTYITHVCKIAGTVAVYIVLSALCNVVKCCTQLHAVLCNMHAIYNRQCRLLLCSVVFVVQSFELSAYIMPQNFLINYAQFCSWYHIILLQSVAKYCL